MPINRRIAEEDLYFLKKTALFLGIEAERIPAVLSALNAGIKRYAKGERIYRAGERAVYMGLVLSGQVAVEVLDVWGNRSMLDSVGPGKVFAETYACLPEEPLMVDVTTSSEASILFLSAEAILSSGREASGQILLRNLLSISSRKNLNLSRKIFHTAPKSIRARLLSYLSFQALSAGSRTFTIPYNRQQLADYLGVDRSALSAELGKMQREGLLETQKSRFRLFCDLPDSGQV